MNRFKKVSFRLKGWDYRKKASYFITICTKNRQHYFGKIENKKMILSNIGVIADILWHEIKNHTNNIKLDEFVVMPNHIHGILIIDSVAPLHETGLQNQIATDQQNQISTELQNQQNQYFSDISPKAGSISTIIRSYKSAIIPKVI